MSLFRKAYRCIIVVLVFLLITGCFFALGKPPLAEKGQLDLREWDFSQNGPIPLKGQWELYWNTFIDPSLFSSDSTIVPDNYLTIPGLWNNIIIDNEKLNGHGFATLHLSIIFNRPRDNLGLKILTFATAAKVFVNGNLLLHSGIPGKNYPSSEPYYFPAVSGSFDSDRQLDIVIHISNFHHRKGGVWRNIMLGDYHTLKKRQTRNTMIDFFLLGSIFIMAFYHLILYVYRTNDTSALFFSLAGFSIGFRVLSTGEYYISRLYPVSWSFIIHLEYISMFLSLVFIILFVYSIFPHDMNKKIVYVFTGLCLLFILVIIFSPVSIFSYFTIPFQYMIILSGIYGIYVLVIVGIKKRESWLPMSIGFIFLLLAAINDIFHNSGILQTGNYISFGLFIFIFTQSALLAVRFSKSFTLSEKLAGELTFINKNLEGIVKSRTSEIENQKEELEMQAEHLEQAYQQLKNLDRFKQGMTAMIVHDLKNPLSLILEHSKGQNSGNREQIQKILFKIHERSKQMLNLVLNILDIQKYEDEELKLSLKTQDIGRIIDKSIESVRFLAENKNIRFDLKNIQMQVVADEEIIERVIINLLTNAIKYSPYNESVIIYGEAIRSNRYKNIEDNKHFCFYKLYVEDKGPGIPPDKVDHIFSKFGQVLERKSGKIRSTGLGLTFSKIAVEAHGGEIGFINNKHTGATFWFTIPCKKEAVSEKFKTKIVQKEDDIFEKVNRIKDILTYDEKAILQQFREKVADYEIFEISAIRREFSDFDQYQSNGITMWKEYFEQAVYTSNESLFHHLLCFFDDQKED